MRRSNDLFYSVKCNNMVSLLLSHLEKHQDGHRAGEDVRHPVVGHLLPPEAPGGADRGGVQAGAGAPAEAALQRRRQAPRGGGGRHGPP